jgi:hypothetical protein
MLYIATVYVANPKPQAGRSNQHFSVKRQLAMLNWHFAIYNALDLADTARVHQQMKAIDHRVRALRSGNHLIAASLLAAWKGCLAFLGLLAVAFLYRHDQQSIVAFGKLGMALIGLASWMTDAYFIRCRWRRDVERERMRDAA